MTEKDLFDCIDGVLRPLGFVSDLGEEFPTPELDILRYDVRRVRLSWVPVVGRGLSVMAVVREPGDLRCEVPGCLALADRVGKALNNRFALVGRYGGLAIGLTTIVLARGPLQPADEGMLEAALPRVPRGRATHLGWFRIDLEREAMAVALRPGPAGVFPETALLSDALGARLGRFLPPVAWE
jgi:hypothetical protein